jgi:hypothetical protein
MTSRGGRRRRMCGDKQRWQSEMVARNVATALGWKGRGHMGPYLCEYCSYWHIGHPLKART